MAINTTSLKNLNHNKSHWNNSQTCVIRVPEKFKHEIIEYAKKLDNNYKNDESITNDLIKDLLLKIDRKEKGYLSNSAGKLIKDIRAIALHLF